MKCPRFASVIHFLPNRGVDPLRCVSPCSGQVAGDYNGPREAEGIVRHVKKISGPAAEEIKSAEDLDKLKTAEKVVVVSSSCTSQQ